uniref:ATPase-like protein n=1 Tax=Rhodopseudomonas palustris (strain BisA53) TaxID=316055 RepID=Q07ID4_RHOP5
MPMLAGAITKQAAHLPKWAEAKLRALDRPPGWWAESRNSAVVLVDIAGFTEMTSKAASDGAEGLTAAINSCFEVLTDVIVANSGDILALAGDAVLAVWDTPNATEAAQFAAGCGLALRTAMLASHGTENIGLRIAVEIGPVSFCKLGGWQNRWFFVAVGEPFLSVGEAYRRAKIGDVALCPNISAVLAEHSDTEPTPYGVRLLRIPPRQQSASEKVSTRPATENAKVGSPHAGVGEFRTVSVVRIALTAPSFDGEHLGAIQDLVFESQQVAARLEGTIHQVIMDDKGLTVTLIFGLAPFAHEDDPLRAVEASLRIRRQMDAIKVATSIGVATGRLFCSDYGGTHCKTYGVFGQAINTAALLAEASQGEIACDSATAQAVGRRIAFNLLPQIHLKSSNMPMLAFSPIAPVDEPFHHSANGMVGRTKEQAMLRSCLADVALGLGTVVLVSGEAGIGKSRLLDDFVSFAEANGEAVLLSAATAIEKSTPYFAWRTILRQALTFKAGADAARIRAELADALSDEVSLPTWLPLLESIIPLGLIETELTRQIVGSARASAIEDLVLFILRRSRARILVFEDLHWLDSPSIDLLSAVARRLPEFMIVASRRATTSRSANEGQRADLVASLHIRLDKLSLEEVELILKHRLRAVDIPHQLTRLIYDSANGNPFFCEELVLSLRDNGQIQLSRGVCVFDERRALSLGYTLPTSVERAVVSRIDVLCDDDQLLLKAASSIGEAFSVDLLENAFPDLISSSKEQCITRLVENNFLQPDQDSQSPRFSFRHSITMEVAYNLLSFALRRTLHERVASFIERSHPGDLQPHYARLARHWELANDVVRALNYLELASRASRNNYANRESIRYAEKMFELTRRESLSIDESRKALWEAILGDAYHELSDYDNSAEHYASAMQLLGRRIPSTKAGKLGALAMNGSVQLVSRMFPTIKTGLIETRRDDIQLMSHIYEYLSEQYFFQNDSLAVLNGTLASLNLAERSGAAPETIRGYTALALGMAMSGLVSLARSYGARAVRLAERHGSLPDVARVELVLGVMAYGLGTWTEAEQHADKALSMYKRLGDRGRAQTSVTMAIFVAILRGDIDRADRLLTDLGSEISADSSMQVKAWSLSARILIDTILGTATSQHLGSLKELAGSKLIRTDQLLCCGVAAVGHLHREEYDSALEFAERGLLVLNECGVVWGGYVFGAAGIAEVLFALCDETLPFQGKRDRIRDRAHLASRQLSRLARTSPICRPYARLARGNVAQLAGKANTARGEWEKAAAAAKSLGMPREQARAIAEIGKSAAVHDSLRQDHLGKALDILKSIGAAGELVRLAHARNAYPTVTRREGQSWQNAE